jgi:homoserine O-succinyltransferase
MSLVIDGGRVPSGWAAKKSHHPETSADNFSSPAEAVRIAFINNMPDSALEDTEMQFFELLDAAAGTTPVHLRLFSLPGVPRSDRGVQHLSRYYSGITDLWSSRVDAVVMTGTEPRQPNLRDEPYWPVLTTVLDWAERETVSTVLSCLAAHAAVLHSDGIARHPLSDKQFGVFDYKKTCEHPLTSHTKGSWRFPHSRWNEVREDALTSCGYTVLANSHDAGVDSFIKVKKKSLFVHFQGHPEYSSRTLLKEYRRDIKRFLRSERETYPSMPKGYFDAAATARLKDFQMQAQSRPSEEIMGLFPEGLVSGGLKNTWQSSAVCMYQNWLHYVLSKKAGARAIPPATGLGHARSTVFSNEVA